MAGAKPPSTAQRMHGRIRSPKSQDRGAVSQALFSPISNPANFVVSSVLLSTYNQRPAEDVRRLVASTSSLLLSQHQTAPNRGAHGLPLKREYHIGRQRKLFLYFSSNEAFQLQPTRERNCPCSDTKKKEICPKQKPTASRGHQSSH